MALNISTTIIKASGLSAMIFWLIIFSKDFSYVMFPIVFLSMIPISICCALTICLTIAPFYRSKKETTSFKTIYKLYFPFYAIALFGLCFYVLLDSDFDTFIIAFITAAFYTSLKSWSWLIEPKKQEQHDIL